MSIEYITYTVNGFKYRDIYELKPSNEYGDKEYDFEGVQVLTPECGWKDCTSFCDKLCNNCKIANEFKELLGI